MRPGDAISIGDLRRMARRRLPKILFDLIESGVEDERGLLRNERAFHDHCLLPRYLVDVGNRDQGAELFGRRYASPFGIAPTGFAGLLRHGADVMLAEAAKAANIPFILSGASAASMEKIAAIAPDHAWCHLYAAKDRAITNDLLGRARDCGLRTLVLTVDNPVYPKRERDMRNGFTLPLKLRLPILLEALCHPAWIAEYLASGGMPVMETWARYAPKGATAEQVATFFRTQSPTIQTWRDMEVIRRDWPGQLVLKGIQHPDDAVRAEEIGVDGIVVSNHGGKAFDPLPSPLATLPAVRRAVRGRIAVMFDSGIRRGADVIIARCLGAQFVFVGRATLYGMVAGGEQGVARAIEILRQEIDLGLALVGCPNFQDLGPEYLIASLAGSPSGQARAAVPAKTAPPRNTPRSPPNLFLVPS